MGAWQRIVVKRSDVSNNESNMLKQPINEVDEWKVVLKDVIHSIINLKQNISMNVDASACAQPHNMLLKSMIIPRMMMFNMIMLKMMFPVHNLMVFSLTNC